MKRRAIGLAIAGGGVILAAAFLLHNPFSVYAQQTQLNTSAPAPCCTNVAPREIDFPYYSLKDGFHSTLMLVSDSPNPIDLTIHWHSQSARPDADNY